MAPSQQRSSAPPLGGATEPQYDYWLSLPFWSRDAGLALVFGKDPRFFPSKTLDDLAQFNAFAATFLEARARFSRDLQSLGFLSDWVMPELFVIWATNEGIQLPLPLRRFARRTELLRRSLREVDARLIVQSQPPEMLTDAVPQQPQSGAAMGAEDCSQAYTGSAVRASSERKLPEAELSTKERSTALKIILGMAIGGYGFDPSARRSPATKEITDDIHRVGLAIDEDTVRKYLGAAAEAHSPGTLSGDSA